MDVLVGAATIEVGVVLDGKYEISGVLGQGGMGVVYEAMHKRLRRKVALKTLSAGFANDAELVARFEREALAASAIGHPNIVQVFDAAGDPLPYLVMEHLEGQSLGELLASEGPLEPARALALCQQALVGLAAAHAAGIVHRDLKPDNLFVAHETGPGAAPGAELVKILDFGISKILQGPEGENHYDGRATKAGMVMGTPLYMSPEQAAGRADIDPRSDLWSMACVLYECLAGVPPFQGEHHNQIMAAVLKGEFAPLAERCPGVSAGICAVVDKALNADVNQRFTDATSMARALEDCDAAGPASAPVDLAAFDNLADRFLAQEAEDSVDREIPETPPDPSTPAPRDERFAPPESSEPVSLALDLAVDVEGPPPRHGGSSVSSARPSQRKKSEWVTRDEPSRFWASLFKFVLLVGLMAGAAAGYRYYTLGYILPKPPPLPATLQVEVLPADATFLLDGQKQDERGIELVGGVVAQIGLRADGYVSMRAAVTPEAGQSVTLRAQMGHQLPTIDGALPGEPSAAPLEAPDLSVEGVDSGYEKLAALVDCGARLSKSLREALPSAEDGEPTPVAYGLTDECRLTIDIYVSKQPAIAPLDGSSTALVTSIEALNEALRNHKTSTAAKSKVRRETRAAVQRASALARRSRKAFLEAMNLGVSRWLAEDARRVEAREGESMHARLRALLVASDARSRATMVGSKSAGKLRDVLVAAHEQASKDAAQHPKAYAESGGQALLSAMMPLLSEASGEQVLEWHNQAVGLFNQLKLPMERPSPH